jgi:hypothetical protein
MAFRRKANFNLNWGGTIKMKKGILAGILSLVVIGTYSAAAGNKSQGCSKETSSLKILRKNKRKLKSHVGYIASTELYFFCAKDKGSIKKRDWM